MDIVHTIAEVREKVRKAKAAGGEIGFVPTMGYLHQGHLSLVKLSSQFSDYQVMSIFVNRIQFNDKNDYNSYPQDLQRDFNLAEKAGVDLIFVPDEMEMYNNNQTTVDVAGITEYLCGAHRQGHFEGVFTVVSKLFNIVEPDISVFGQKDIQQAVSIEKMIHDLNFPVKIIIAPIIREDDGVAMSSRNVRLSPEERIRARALYQSLKFAEQILKDRERKSSVIEQKIKDIILAARPDKIDYISIVNYQELAPIDLIEQKSVIAVAVFFSNVRLIDNMIINFNSRDIECVY